MCRRTKSHPLLLPTSTSVEFPILSSSASIVKSVVVTPHHLLRVWRRPRSPRASLAPGGPTRRRAEDQPRNEGERGAPLVAGAQLQNLSDEDQDQDGGGHLKIERRVVAVGPSPPREFGLSPESRGQIRATKGPGGRPAEASIDR